MKTERTLTAESVCFIRNYSEAVVNMGGIYKC